MGRNIWLTVGSKSLEPFYIVSNNINWVNTSCTYCLSKKSCPFLYRDSLYKNEQTSYTYSTECINSVIKTKKETNSVGCTFGKRKLHKKILYYAHHEWLPTTILIYNVP